MKERSAVRVIPRNAITVVIENEGLPFTYGVVANISEGGACVWTNGRFAVGESLHLRLSFAREPEPFEAAGVIVWGDAVPQRNQDIRYGLQWESVASPSRERLLSLISGSA
jgi:Tfp pilus assembly protein PilZ